MAAPTACNASGAKGENGVRLSPQGGALQATTWLEKQREKQLSVPRCRFPVDHGVWDTKGKTRTSDKKNSAVKAGACEAVLVVYGNSWHTGVTSTAAASSCSLLDSTAVGAPALHAAGVLGRTRRPGGPAQPQGPAYALGPRVCKLHFETVSKYDVPFFRVAKPET